MHDDEGVNDKRWLFKKDKKSDKREIDFTPYMKNDKNNDLEISIAPLSTHLSQRTQADLNHANNDSVNLNLLQLTVSNRVIIFDLAD